jgi:hypothetical protein
VYRHQLGALSRDVAGQYGNSGIAAGYHQTVADRFVLLIQPEPRPRWAPLEEYGVGRRQPPDGWRSSHGYCTRAHLRELHRLPVINIRTFGQQIGFQSAFGARRRYHAFQAHLERRFARGLTFTAAFTFSKLIDDASSVFDAAVLTGPVANYPVADSFNRHLERDLSAGDIPCVFSTGFVYELPMGRGRRLALHGWRDALLGGWQIAGIVRAQSGVPVAVVQQPNFNSFAGFGTQRPNRVADANLANDERTLARYFNTDAFQLAPRFTIGNSSRNPVRGPGYQGVGSYGGQDVSDRRALASRIPNGSFQPHQHPAARESQREFRDCDIWQHHQRRRSARVRAGSEDPVLALRRAAYCNGDIRYC